MFKPIADWLVYDLIGLSPESRLGEALDFFIWDTMKIFFMMLVIIFAVSYLRSYLPPQRVRRFLSQKLPVVGNFFAAGVGVATPFCTCSAIPLFIGFVEAGVPLGVTFSYLVSAPMVNEVALILLIGLVGWKVAGIYLATGLSVAVVSGLIIGWLGLEKFLQKEVHEIQFGVVQERQWSQRERLRYSVAYTRDILKRIWLFIVIGIAVGAFIHGYVPEDIILRFSSQSTLWGVPTAVLLGVPLYAGAAGAIPIVTALLAKGLPLGTALAFLMAVTALSLPEFIILRKVMKTRLLLIFAGILTVSIILTGYLFNFVV